MNFPPSWQLPPEIENSFSDKIGRQRAIRHEDHLLISLHWVPQVNNENRIGLFLYRQPDGGWYSYRPHIDGFKPVDPAEPDPHHQALREMLDEYEQIEDQLEKRQEKASNATTYLTILRETITIQHAIRNLHDTLESLPADVGESMTRLRDYAYQIRRSYDLLQSFSRNELDIYQAQQAEEGNRTAKILNQIAAFTLPMTAIASIFGMEILSVEQMSNPFLWLFVALGTVWGFGLYWAIR